MTWETVKLINALESSKASGPDVTGNTVNLKGGLAFLNINLSFQDVFGEILLSTLLKGCICGNLFTGITYY